MKHTFKRLFAMMMALAMVFSMLPVSGVFAAEASDVLTISTAEEWNAFAAAVNAGNSYEGKTVELANDIDLNYTAVVVGTNSNSFKGTFDGKNYTISNLTVFEGGYDNDYFADTDDCIGLFGRIDSPAVIKNVTVADPFIVGQSYVGGIVGMAYTGKIENCHVTGEIDIEGNYFVGGITGHGYAKIYDCSVIGAEGWDYSYIGAEYKESDLEGDNVGGIVGHNAETNTISGCTVKNVTVSGTRKVGGIVGYTAQNGTIVDCTVSNVIIETTATAEYAASKASTMSIGGVVGQYGKAGNNDGVLSGCTVANVTFANENDVTVSIGALAGGLRGSADSTVAPADAITAENNNISSVTGTNVTYLEPEVVKPAGVATYEELVAALANGGEIKLAADIVVSDTLKVPYGVTAVLELNGKTISQAKSQTAHYEMILVDGNLTIQDSVGSGKISYTDTNQTAHDGASNTITNRGTLTLLSGTVENLSSATVADYGYPYAIDSSIWGSASEVNTIIKGGKVVCNSYSAMRLRGDSTTEAVNVTVEGGEIVGTIEVQNSSSVKAVGKLTISGGTLSNSGTSNVLFVFGNPTALEAEITGGDFTGNIVVRTSVSETFDSKFIKGGTFTTDVSGFCVEGFACEANADGSYSVVEDVPVTGLSGSGTEADPFLINNLEELIWFRDHVDTQAADGSSQYAGKYVKLTADIDLAGINWNPIGSMSGDHGSFAGIFDGDGHTISNLNVQQSGNGIGLFARTSGNAEIKNLTLNNVTVKSINNSSYVGAVVGNSYESTKITNVHVTGAIDISGRGYIGGISGHGYVKMDNVSVVGEGTISSTFWCAGGILGYGGEGSTNIANAKVEGTGIGLTITSAAGGLGAIVGMAEDNKGTQPISGANLSAKNVDIKTYTGAYGDSYSNYALGYLYGGNPTSILTGELSVEDVTIETSNGVEPTVQDAVASVDGVIYFNLQAAFNAGGEVKLLRDIVLTNAVTVPAGKTVVLDLNGKTISQTKVQTAAYSMIVNNGELTITGDGVISYTDSGNGGEYVSNTILNSGVLTIKSGTIENLSSATTANNGYPQAIDTNGKLIVEGGTITCANYSAIRIWCTTDDNTSVVIKDGIITGSVDLHNVSGKANKGSLSIEGGTINQNGFTANVIRLVNFGEDIDELSIAVSGGTVNGGIGITGSVKTVDMTTMTTVTGGTFATDVSAYCAEGFVCEANADGSYSVLEDPSAGAVAKIGDSYFTTLADAFAAANDNDTIVLIEDIALDASVLNTKNVTLDLAGKTITGTDNNTSGNFYLINNSKGNLTIDDSVGGGKITLTAVNERNWSSSSVVVANNLGTVTVEGGTIEHLGGTSMAYAIDNLTNGANTVATLNINGGVINSTYFAVRQFANNGTNNLNVTGGDIGYMWMQSPNNNVNVANISVTGGEVDGICLSGANADVTMTVAPNTTAEVYGTAPAGMVILGSPENGFTLIEEPELPTATITEVENDDLTFAMNFKTDAATAEQLAYYGKWYADFVLTVNKDVTFYTDGGDGYLSGQYDAYSENWVNVPFNKAVTLKAGESVKIMELAAELMGKPGLKYTYGEVYESVKDFDCGVFFTDLFLIENPDLEVTLELRMYNPANMEETYVIGETYTFEAPEIVPELPTATITEVENVDLTFAMNFKTDAATAEQLAYYGKWYADFVLTVNKDVTFYTDGGDGYLSGQYDAYSENWINVPFNKAVTLKAGESVKIMELAAELMNKQGLKYTYAEVYEVVKDFDCGVFFEPEFLAANPDLEVTLELRMFNPANEEESFVIGETYIFEAPKIVCENTATGAVYATAAEGLMAAKSGETVRMLTNSDEMMIAVFDGLTFDLNGYTVTSQYVASYGNIVDTSVGHAGKLVVSKERLMIRNDNKYMPIKDSDGAYHFVDMPGIAVMKKSDVDTGIIFMPYIMPDTQNWLKAGFATSGVSIRVYVEYTTGEGVEEKLTKQIFEYKDEMVQLFVDSWTGSNYSQVFNLVINNADEFTSLKITAAVTTEHGVEFLANTLEF